MRARSHIRIAPADEGRDDFHRLFFTSAYAGRNKPAIVSRIERGHGCRHVETARRGQSCQRSPRKNERGASPMWTCSRRARGAPDEAKSPSALGFIGPPDTTT